MGYKKISGIIGLILVCAWLGALPVQATPYNWIDGNGNWNNSANWDPSGVPNGGGDTAGHHQRLHRHHR